MTKFQSLFSWNLPSDIVKAQGVTLQPGSFNPCFLGTCPRTCLADIRIRSKHQGFNPCFLGTCPRTQRSCFLACRYVWFQSLFSWNLPSDGHANGYDRFLDRVSILVFLELALGPISWNSALSASVCFNPCFLGTCPRTLTSMKTSSSGLSVSILVFLELALGLDEISAYVEGWEVSILVFLELALGH